MERIEIIFFVRHRPSLFGPARLLHVLWLIVRIILILYLFDQNLLEHTSSREHFAFLFPSPRSKIKRHFSLHWIRTNIIWLTYCVKSSEFSLSSPFRVFHLLRPSSVSLIITTFCVIWLLSLEEVLSNVWKKCKSGSISYVPLCC